MVSIVLVYRCLKTSLTVVQNSPQNRLAAMRLGLRGSWTMLCIVFGSTPLKLLLDLKRRNYHALLFMVSIVSVDARKTSLNGVQNSNNNKNRLVDDAPCRHWVNPPPPLSKKPDPIFRPWIPTLWGGRRKQFYVILLQEVPENAPNVVLKLQMLPTHGGGCDPLPDPPPLGRSATSPLTPRSIVFSYISPHAILCPPPPPPR